MGWAVALIEEAQGVAGLACGAGGAGVNFDCQIGLWDYAGGYEC